MRADRRLNESRSSSFPRDLPHKFHRNTCKIVIWLVYFGLWTNFSQVFAWMFLTFPPRHRNESLNTYTCDVSCVSGNLSRRSSKVRLHPFEGRLDYPHCDSLNGAFELLVLAELCFNPHRGVHDCLPKSLIDWEHAERGPERPGYLASWSSLLEVCGLVYASTQSIARCKAIYVDLSFSERIAFF